MTDTVRLPQWLTKPLSNPTETRAVRSVLHTHGLNTVCDEAKCPNRVDCFSRGTATFMILGNRCTRDCGFCAVTHGRPTAPDPREPERVARAAADLGLRHVVVTSVTRDDLRDGGAGHFAATVDEVRRALPDAGVEVLVPDFLGETRSIELVLGSRPDVFAHNVETVGRLYDDVRSRADYERSLSVLAHADRGRPRPLIKSSLMLGMGETGAEVNETLLEILEAGVDIVTLGQYLRPSAAHRPVARFLPPEEFKELREACLEMGFGWVSSGPFVRSSYRAEEAAEALGRGRNSSEPTTQEAEPDEN